MNVSSMPNFVPNHHLSLYTMNIHHFPIRIGSIITAIAIPLITMAVWVICFHLFHMYLCPALVISILFGGIAAYCSITHLLAHTPPATGMPATNTTPQEPALHTVEQDTLEYMQAKEDEIQQLKKLENYRKEFLGNVAHELKTPLTSIQGQILTLIDGGIYDENINMSYLKRSAFNIDRMISVVNDLDEISKLEYDRYQLKMENFNICTLIQEVSDTLEMKAQKLGVNIIFDFNNDLEYIVNADKDNIQKVLVNLIDNAIKYNDKENKEVRIAITPLEKAYLIAVSDNGIGIDNQYLPRIFERFFRVDKDRSRKTGGSGLGLAIVKHIIDAHQQNLNVQSEPGVGTTFSFTLQKGV